MKDKIKELIKSDDLVWEVVELPKCAKCKRANHTKAPYCDKCQSKERFRK